MDPNSDYPGGEPFSREYREIFGQPSDWEMLYAAQSFRSKDEEEIDVDFSGKFSDKQKMQIAQDIANNRRLPSGDYITEDDGSSSRKQKKKAPRGSNNNFTERVFPSGLIQTNPKDKFDNNAIDPGSIVPALRGQMPVITKGIMNFIPASMVSSRCKCNKNLMWDGMGCEVEGMLCDMEGQRGMTL
jgi:hypothetical protein